MPLLTEYTIEQVKDRMQIEEVVSQFVQLDKKHKACCPFHNENTPSFTVTPAKGIYKCFGCGASGDAIKFVMDFERKEFIDAVKYLAEFYGISVEYEKKEMNKSDAEELKQMNAINKSAANFFQRNLMEMPYNSELAEKLYNELIERRQLSYETIIEFQLGYADKSWNQLTEVVIKKGLFAFAEKLGLCKSKNGKNFDFYRHRIMFPIHDQHGTVVGFSGRLVDGAEQDAKYLNSTESRVYKKDKILYGLFQAQKAIREKKQALLVEGNYDVVSFHQKGLNNTVAPCGTGFTESQARLLKKYTDNVVIIFDGDKAGQKATLKAIDILIKVGFSVKVFALPDSEDPDSFARKFESGEELEKEIEANKTDAITFKAVEVWNSTDKTDPHAQDMAFNEICALLALIDSEFKREKYTEAICKAIKQKVSSVNAGIKKIKDAEDAKKKKETDNDFDFVLPEGVDREEFLRYGFYEQVDGVKTGYYFHNGGKFCENKSNFVIKPLFHIYSKSDNKRMIEINNGMPGGLKIIEMQSKSLQSLDQFSAAVFDEGYYIFTGQKPHLQKILSKIGNNFPLCYELKTLGWQSEGFFAFNNYIYNTSLVPFNEYGIVSHNDKNYFSPSASLIQRDVRKEDDEYENDRYLTYCEAPVDFSGWAELMNKVYGDNGNLGIAFSFVALFRDIIFKLTNSCPFLYGYGQVQSGKSTWADSVSNLFFKELKAFNLNQGTDFAFFARLGRFRNCPVVFNEFDEHNIKENWFRAIKAVYDGEGRERGRNGSKDKTETQKINVVLVLLGQYLSTKDDGSVLSRAIIAEFKQVNERTQEQKELWHKLKDMEHQGLSGILIEMLQHREMFKEKYPENFHIQLKKLKESIKEDGGDFKERIVTNYSILLTCIYIFSQKINLPFTYEYFFNFCKKEVVRLSTLINESNALASFWKTVEFLLDQNEIFDGWDFKIVPGEMSVTVRKDKEDVVKHFETPTKLLYIRFTNIHKMYERLCRMNSGTNGINESTLHLYLSQEKGFVGNTKSVRFTDPRTKKSMTTSAYVFNYDELGLNIEREAANTDTDYNPYNFGTVGTGAAAASESAVSSANTPKGGKTEEIPF